MTFQVEAECRIIWPGQLIGAAQACAILHIDRSTLSRRIRDGKLVPLAQLDGPNGAFVFDRTDVEGLARVR
ncbi:hypothetical protein [Curtobacterium sp. 1544]|uniref:hypothetical protein n=1 Tax=Curtobacterium sp. 1544 TaxID=3156417 RepID=UPI0033934ABF